MIGKSQFEGLTQLIEYYKKRPLYITKNNQEIKLTKPVEMIPLDEVIIAAKSYHPGLVCFVQSHGMIVRKK